MDKISVNVTDSVYGSKCNACNSVYAISLSNRVVFLEGAQEAKKGQNRNPILPFFCARPRHYRIFSTTGKSPYEEYSQFSLYEDITHSYDCRKDSVLHPKIPTLNRILNAIMTYVNKGAM